MRDDEFNAILNHGALAHPMFPFRLSRLAMCLRYVIESVPGADAAFRRWCRERDRQDEAYAKSGDPEIAAYPWEADFGPQKGGAN